jgi:lipoprotein-anchoring transpeptidase ErfK/SrfK
MDNQNNEAHDLIVKGREALRRGDKETAHNLGEQAALLDPGLEDAWLILTASDPNPEDSLAYAQQALEINPSSERALKAVEWAIARLKQAQTTPAVAVAAAESDATAAVSPGQENLQETTKPINRTGIYVGVALVLLLCLVAAFAVYQGVTNPTFASLINSSGLNKVTETTQAVEKHWAPMSLPKPSGASIQNGGSSQQIAITATTGPVQDRPTSVPTGLPASVPTLAVVPSSIPSEVPTEAATATSQASDAPQTAGTPQGVDSVQTADAPQTAADTAQTAGTSQVTETPVVMSMAMVADVPASQPANQPVPASSNAPLPADATDGSGAHWIDVDLSNQMVYAYAGDSVVNSFLVSTGTWLHPTVVGQYHIYVKYRSAPMSGPGYYLPDVPYIMYFYKGYGLHGTYWHSNFGTPMSHGCVNLRTDQAAWLYNWASVGTLVNIHY